MTHYLAYGQVILTWDAFKGSKLRCTKRCTFSAKNNQPCETDQRCTKI